MPDGDARSVPHALKRAFCGSPRGSTALTGPFGTLTYEDLEGAVGAVAGALHRAGIPRHGTIAIWTSRRDYAVLGLLGAMQAGAVPCIVEPRATAEQLRARLEAVRIAWLLVDENLRSEALSLTSQIPLSVVPFSPHAGADRYFDESLEPGDAALLLFTSGSTGQPKGVLLSHRNLLANSAGVTERTGISAADRLLHLMPLHHTNGINNQILAPLLAGASVALMERFRAQEIYSQIATWRPTYFTGVPTMFSRMLAGPLPASSVCAGLRFARCGSAPMSEALHRQIEERLGVPLIISYGLSEATCTSLMNPPEARKIGSVGTSLRGQTVALLRPGSREEVRSDEVGEICISGPTVMMGYLQQHADQTDRSAGDGWIRTGDLGRRDAEGYFSITGRLKEVIIRGGENISPQAVESALLSHSAVEAAAVVGVPDADLGELPIAFVVTAASASEEAVKDHVRAKLGAPSTPSRIFFVGELPETGIGKIDRGELRRQAYAKLGMSGI